MGRSASADDALAADASMARHRLRVRGVVQGVGFRPFVHRLATELRPRSVMSATTRRRVRRGRGRSCGGDRVRAAALDDNRQPLARVERSRRPPSLTRWRARFRIVESRSRVSGGERSSPPDIAVCDDCLRELFDPADRRSATRSSTAPTADRASRSLCGCPTTGRTRRCASFAMCAACAAEYHDPARPPVPRAADRVRGVRASAVVRVRAGTVDGTDASRAAAQRRTRRRSRSSRSRGSAATTWPATPTSTTRSPASRAQEPRRQAVRGHGARSRRRARDSPRSMRREAALSDRARQRPIVLAGARRDRRRPARTTRVQSPGEPARRRDAAVHAVCIICCFTACRASSTPVPDVLVMTSGNLSDEPICYDDADARDAPRWHRRCVARARPADPCAVRRLRGARRRRRRATGAAFAWLCTAADSCFRSMCPPSLAVGGELKNTFCLASGRDAWMSQHIGDMGSVETLAAFERSTQQFAEHVRRRRADRVVADAHPRLPRRVRWAEDRTTSRTRSMLRAAPSRAHRGGDGRARPGEGSEVDRFRVRWHGLRRRRRDLGRRGAGGELRGVRARPPTCATCRCRAAMRRSASRTGRRSRISGRPASSGRRISPRWWRHRSRAAAVLQRQLERGVHCVPTSSMGRLFDAVSSLLGCPPRRVVRSPGGHRVGGARDAAS